MEADMGNGEGNENYRNLIVSDFDGTLFFSDESMRLASREVTGVELSAVEVRKLPRGLKGKIHDLVATKYRDYLVPNEELIDVCRRHKAAGYGVYVLSARGKEFSTETIEILDKYGVPHDRVVLSPDHSMGDGEWKASVLDDLIGRSEQVLFFEDKQDNIDMARQATRHKNIEYYLVSRGCIKSV